MPLRIIVVDECAHAREAAVDAVTGSGEIAVVAQASTAAEAKEMVERLEPDLLLVGSATPGRASRAMQEMIGSGGRTRLAVLTSSEHQADVFTALRCGVSGYILIGSAVDLAEALMRLHGSGVYVSPELGTRLLLDYAQSQGAAAFPTDGQFSPRDGRLSEREREITSLVRQGYRNKEIAGRLHIQEATVKQHLSSVFRKLHVHNRAELAALA